MMINLLKSKIHRITVTGSDLHYEGSIFIDENILKEANILPYEKVEIYNINNGNRFSTYAVPVQQKDACYVNGAAARLVYKGDLIIVCTFAFYTQEEAQTHKPTVLLK